MQIYGIFTENAWKITENMRKIVEFPRNSFLNLLLDAPFSRSFPVIFRSFSRSFLEKIGEFRRISEKIREYRGKSENFGENLSFSFLFIPPPPQITPILCSKTYSLQILLKFLAFFLAVSNFLLTFATVYKMIVIYPAGRPFRLWLLAAGFFYA